MWNLPAQTGQKKYTNMCINKLYLTHPELSTVSAVTSQIFLLDHQHESVNLAIHTMQYLL